MERVPKLNVWNHAPLDHHYLHKNSRLADYVEVLSPPAGFFLLILMDS